MVETLRFDAAPDLRRLFPAALANRRSGGSALPDVVAERRGVTVDAAEVADYAHLCGFGLDRTPARDVAAPARGSRCRRR